ncbi:MAG: sulfatase [Acidobacteriota bacterium]
MALALVVIAAITTSGCGGKAEPPAARASGDIPRATRGYILISIDTLRADHLGCYGYAKPTSPFLDSLARRATLFEEAYAQYPSTLVSHMSMLTGLHPREHGVYPPSSVLSDKVEILPEVFQRAGFRTGAFTEGGFLRARYGFRRGFDVFSAQDRQGARKIKATFGRAVRFLEGIKPEDRFFVFVHTYAVHTPYDAPPKYREPFWNGGEPPGAIPATGPGLTRHNATGERLQPPVVDWLTALYDAGIRQTDEVVRDFFADLARLGLDDEVTVIVTSDHGEELHDHGKLSHTRLYRETLHVPLLVVHPDQRSAVRHRGVVQLLDLPATLYDLARLKPRDRSSGVSRAGLLGREAEPVAGTAWAEVAGGERAVYRGEARSLESLLLFDPSPDDWIPRRASFDVSGETLTFEARSFGRPRRLAVRQNGQILGEAALTPEWAAVRPVRLAGPGRVELEADGCVMEEPEHTHGGQGEYKCRGFQVRGVRLSRVELYDVANDPGQRRDLARERSRSTRVLLRDLLAFKPRVVAEASAPPLDPETEKNLRALGYLQ